MKKKLLISLSIFIFAILSMVTTTLAWFSVAQSATVSELSLTVGQGGNLDVSLDGETYYSNLSESEFGTFIRNNMKLTNVTTNDLVDFRNSYYGDEAVANVDYLTFTLYFRCDDPDMTGLYLANDVSEDYSYDAISNPNNKIEGTYVKSEGKAFRTPITFNWSDTVQREAGTTSTYLGADALRLGFKELAFDAEDTREDEELLTVIFDPSHDEERSYDKVNGVKEFGAFDFIRKTVKSDLTAPTENLPEVIYDLSTFRYGREAQSNTSLLGTFQHRQVVVNEETKDYYFSKIQVSVWLEGWDPDCINGIYDDIMRIQLFFRSAVKFS